MLNRKIIRRECFGAAIVWLALVMASVSCAADGPALKRLFPAGAGRGQVVEVSAQGTAPNWPVTIWCDDPHVHWQALSEKGKFRVTVDATARLGLHHVRFLDGEGAGDAMRFLVGPIAEQNEAEPNDGLQKLQPVSALPLVLNGVLEKRGDVDTFAVDLDERQVLVAAVEANQYLRSPVDTTVQVLSAGGTVVAQMMDVAGLDPVIEFPVPGAGRYYVRVFGFPETPDSTIGFAGSESFVYRLTLCTSGWLKATKPLAVQRSQPTTLELMGIGLPTERWEYRPTSEMDGETLFADIPGLAHAPAWDMSDLPQTLEPVRTESGAHPELTIPSSVTGALDTRKQRDTYRFQAKKGDKVQFALNSRRLALPMDGVLRVLDSEGKQLAREDDTAKQADVRLAFTAPADGAFTLEVSDAFQGGGAQWLYRIDAQPLTGDVVLTVKSDRFHQKVNEEFELPVAIERRSGFDQAITVGIVGLPASVQWMEATSDKQGDSAKEVKLKLKPTEAFSGPLRIVARRSDDPKWSRTATLATDNLLRDIWLHAK